MARFFRKMKYFSVYENLRFLLQMKLEENLKKNSNKLCLMVYLRLQIRDVLAMNDDAYTQKIHSLRTKY